MLNARRDVATLVFCQQDFFFVLGGQGFPLTAIQCLAEILSAFNLASTCFTYSPCSTWLLAATSKASGVSIIDKSCVAKANTG